MLKFRLWVEYGRKTGQTFFSRVFLVEIFFFLVLYTRPSRLIWECFGTLTREPSAIGTQNNTFNIESNRERDGLVIIPLYPQSFLDSAVFFLQECSLLNLEKWVFWWTCSNLARLLQSRSYDDVIRRQVLWGFLKLLDGWLNYFSKIYFDFQNVELKCLAIASFSTKFNTSFRNSGIKKWFHLGEQTSTFQDESKV